ncbi:class I SAM-dependent methyltransferase [Pseudonocardia alaniniphila]|uniref:Class I SAM-dependent methyltransferase n=1 Tax=Pseudonocardia alaniniphila TaxID=75291 RepID=A0ABS9TQD8_9PSEU|nr:class I SAM-dependent methyltransferase [Pseudonocardia alaniniphila]MCH6170759.1 class I SAM-dependent methyltransferase [Pseudonocardia alaniniphila]
MDDGPRGWARPLYERALDAAGVVPGTTLLELGCGSGEFARAAVERGARVTGIDSDRSAVSVAAAAVPGAEFRLGDAHDPPPGPFDVVAAVQLLSHVTNPVLVLRRAASVGATVVVTVWGRDEECDVRAFGEALARWLPPRRAAGGPPPLTDPDRLRKLVALAGLQVAALRELACPFDYADADELVAPVLGSGIGRRAAAAAGPEAVRRALLDRLAAHRLADGGYRLENLFRIYTVTA